MMQLNLMIIGQVKKELLSALEYGASPVKLW